MLFYYTNIISIFSVMVMSIKKTFMGIYNLFSSLSYIMLTLCYYDIDSEQVNSTVSESFIIFPMLIHKSSFPTSSANVSVCLLVCSCCVICGRVLNYPCRISLPDTFMKLNPINWGNSHNTPAGICLA